MNESKATLYQRARRRAEAAVVVSGAGALALVALTPAAAWLARWAAGLGDGLGASGQTAVAIVVFVLSVVVLCELGRLPATLYLALRVDARFHPVSPSVEAILVSTAQATALAWPAACFAAAVLHLATWLAGPWWWLVAGAGLAAAVALALHAAPAVLARLGDARPLDRPGLRERLDRLAREARVPVAGIDEWRGWETAPATAVVAGVGRARRVFLSADVMRDWSDDEVAVVVAHELGHHAYGDLWRTLALDAVVLSVSLGAADLALRWWGPALGLSGAGDLAALPLAALVAGGGWLAATPLRHAQSRRQERRADLFALALTGRTDAFRAVIRRLGDRHLAEERPGLVARWLYFRHPPVDERLAMADAYRRIRYGTDA